MTTNMHSGDVALLYMEYKVDKNLRRMFREHFYKALKLRRSCLVVSFQGYNGFMVLSPFDMEIDASVKPGCVRLVQLFGLKGQGLF